MGYQYVTYKTLLKIAFDRRATKALMQLASLVQFCTLISLGFGILLALHRAF
jgi:hypothetical protein